jgi:hypothetical protein
MTQKQGCCPGRQGERRADFPIGPEALNALTVRRGDGNGEYGAEGFVVLWPAVQLVHERRTSAGQVSKRASAHSPSFKAMTNSVRSQSAMSRTPVCQGCSAATGGSRGSVPPWVGYPTSREGGWASVRGCTLRTLAFSIRVLPAVGKRHGLAPPARRTKYSKK